MKSSRILEERGILRQIPAVIGKPRTTDLETICRYRLIENEILDYKETDYTYLPLVFVDGNLSFFVTEQIILFSK